MGTEAKDTPAVETQTYRDTMNTNEQIEARLRRVESRLVQLMIHLGMDPYNKMYESLGQSMPRRAPIQD